MLNFKKSKKGAKWKKEENLVNEVYSSNSDSSKS